MPLLLLITVHFLLSSLLPVISFYEVKSKLANIKVSKAAGPDGILNRGLKEFSDELAYPITELFNRPFEAGLFPESWKQSFISPIPKTRLVHYFAKVSHDNVVTNVIFRGIYMKDYTS